MWILKSFLQIIIEELKDISFERIESLPFNFFGCLTKVNQIINKFGRLKRVTSYNFTVCKVGGTGRCGFFLGGILKYRTIYILTKMDNDMKQKNR